MTERISVRDAALKWGLTERSVAGMCRGGKIPGAYKEGKNWYIPSDAARPSDGRVKSGAYKVDRAQKKPLPLPLGISDFRIASTQYYYVDKTLLIRDFLDERPRVSLFTRPRRFGKSLNLDMLRTFFETSDEDTSVWFRKWAIWKQGKAYRQYQGKYPVVFVSFRDFQCETWEETLEKFSEVLGNEYARHEVLLSSERIHDVDKAYFLRVMERTADAGELTNALMTLTRLLDEHYRIPPIILVDEYDAPIRQTHAKDYYDRIVLFLRRLFAGGLKDNRHLSFAFLTGILYAAEESVFSGLNSLAVNSVLEDKYSAYFGFTQEEVRQMCAYYGAENHYDEICEWYLGYRFGNQELFNPWSVINYFRCGCRPGGYWQSADSSEIIGRVVEEGGPELYAGLQVLLQGSPLLTDIDPDVAYPDIKKNPSSVYSYLLMTGYLKPVRTDSVFTNGFMCDAALPNKEISFIYTKEIPGRLASIIPQSYSSSIREALYSKNAGRLRELLRKLAAETAGVSSVSNEKVIQGLLLYLTALMGSHFYVRLNRESGESRFGIQLFPKTKVFPAMQLELKNTINRRGK